VARFLKEAAKVCTGTYLLLILSLLLHPLKA
jgi:hypothetical protein